MLEGAFFFCESLRPGAPSNAYVDSRLATSFSKKAVDYHVNNIQVIILNSALCLLERLLEF